jgi:rod shape-determining protein MreC
MNKEKRLANMALLFFATLSLLFLILPTGPLVRSIKAIVSFSTYPFINTAQSLTEISAGVPRNVLDLLNTESENRILREQARDAALMRAQLDAALEENRRLSEIAGFKQDSQWKGVWARVVERDPTHWNSSFMIDRGFSSGIELHDGVVAIQNGKVGLVGKVIEVSRETARVLLITDEMFSVTCYLKDHGWDALAEGQGRELLRLNYLPTEAQTDGGEVFTSKSSVVFPPGISIGTVLSVHSHGNFMTFVSADLLPTVRPGAVKEVFVMKKSQQEAQ